MKKKLQNTLNKFTDSENPAFEIIAVLGIIYLLASFLIRL